MEVHHLANAPEAAPLGILPSARSLGFHRPKLDPPPSKHFHNHLGRHEFVPGRFFFPAKELLSVYIVDSNTLPALSGHFLL
jgi:hypothetical protein